MAEKEKRNRECDQVAKAHLVMLMQGGYPWQEAKAQAGLQISRSTTCRLLTGSTPDASSCHQQLLGHADISTTTIYTRVSVDDLARMMGTSEAL